VLSHSQTKYSSVSDALIRQYEALREGRRPANTAGKFDRCVEIMQALHKVEECETDDPRIAPNPTNPCWLRCHICKAFAMLGTCSHIITITDLIMQTRPVKDRITECDVQKMLTLVDANKKGLRTDSATSAVLNKGGKALNRKVTVARGKYSSKKSMADAARALVKAVAKKAAKERTSAAKKLIGKKTKKPASKKKKKTGPTFTRIFF